MNVTQRTFKAADGTLMVELTFGHRYVCYNTLALTKSPEYKRAVELHDRMTKFAAHVARPYIEQLARDIRSFARRFENG